MTFPASVFVPRSTSSPKPDLEPKCSSQPANWRRGPACAQDSRRVQVFPSAAVRRKETGCLDGHCARPHGQRSLRRAVRHSAVFSAGALGSERKRQRGRSRIIRYASYGKFSTMEFATAVLIRKLWLSAQSLQGRSAPSTTSADWVMQYPSRPRALKPWTPGYHGVNFRACCKPELRA